MVYGYMGKILKVNLTKQSLDDEVLDEEIARKYIGGKCLGAKILFQELKPEVDPLGPENKLIFSTGVLAGIPISGNSRYSVISKSPLSFAWGESTSGGYFAPKLRSSGFDALIIEGVAKQPLYLLLNNGIAELKDADHLWGKTTGETEDTIRRELNESSLRESSIASIGQGGERLVRFACIINDKREAAGRCGLGAVMGSKKLKAIVAKGNLKPKFAEPQRLNELIKQCAREVMDGGNYQGLKDYGTAGGVDDLNESGRLPTKAFLKGTFDGAENITGERMVKSGYMIRRDTCWGCSTNCKRVVQSDKPYIISPEYGGQEYETTAAFGSLCLNNDIYSIGKANELCNRYGIDTISTGVTVAFSMECYERGIITKEETDGIDLTWGSAKAMITIVEMIANRRKIGDILAEGVMRASAKIGHDSETFALHVKGLELPLHEPRGKRGVGLMYAVENRGATHLGWEHDDLWVSPENLRPELGLTEEAVPERDLLDTSISKVKICKIGGDIRSLCNSLLICTNNVYPGGGLEIKTLLEVVKAITGWDMSMKEFLEVGSRGWDLARAFNIREGLRRDHDKLPKRLMEPLPDGNFKGKPITQKMLNDMIEDFYELRGWDRHNGIPTVQRLKDAQLDYVIDEFKKLGIS